MPQYRVLRTVDLTRDQGWAHTTGVRGNVDASYNRRGQTTFGPAGMTITAERAGDGAPIYSSDAQGRFAPVPDHFMVRATITLGDYLGPGCFPAFWFRPAIGGAGELDVWEYMGHRVGSPLLWKTTLISTPYGAQQRQVEKPLPLPNTAGTHRWRYEKTPTTVRVGVDNRLLATITRDEFERVAPGKWDSQLNAGQSWYPRFTYQVNPPATGGYNAAGTVPAGWLRSTMHVSSLTEYVPL